MCGSPSAPATARGSPAWQPAPNRKGCPRHPRTLPRPRAAAGPRIVSPPGGCPGPDRNRPPAPPATASAARGPISARPRQPTPAGDSGRPDRSVLPPRGSAGRRAQPRAAFGPPPALGPPPPAPPRLRSTARPREPPENRNLPPPQPASHPPPRSGPGPCHARPVPPRPPRRGRPEPGGRVALALPAFPAPGRSIVRRMKDTVSTGGASATLRPAL